MIQTYVTDKWILFAVILVYVIIQQDLSVELNLKTLCFPGSYLLFHRLRATAKLVLYSKVKAKKQTSRIHN